MLPSPMVEVDDGKSTDVARPSRTHRRQRLRKGNRCGDTEMPFSEVLSSLALPHWKCQAVTYRHSPGECWFGASNIAGTLFGRSAAGDLTRSYADGLSMSEPSSTGDFIAVRADVNTPLTVWNAGVDHACSSEKRAFERSPLPITRFGGSRGHQPSNTIRAPSSAYRCRSLH